MQGKKKGTKKKTKKVRAKKKKKDHWADFKPLSPFSFFIAEREHSRLK